MPATASQRPGMGGRTSSAPAGDLYKLDVVRKPGSGTKIEHTLLEEDEGSPITGEAIKRTRFSQQEVVRLELTRDSEWFMASVYRELQLLTVSFSPSIGTHQERLPRSDHCSCRRRKRRQDQLC